MKTRKDAELYIQRQYTLNSDVGVDSVLDFIYGAKKQELQYHVKYFDYTGQWGAMITLDDIVVENLGEFLTKKEAKKCIEARANKDNK